MIHQTLSDLVLARAALGHAATDPPEILASDEGWALAFEKAGAVADAGRANTPDATGLTMPLTEVRVTVERVLAPTGLEIFSDAFMSVTPVLPREMQEIDHTKIQLEAMADPSILVPPLQTVVPLTKEIEPMIRAELVHTHVQVQPIPLPSPKVLETLGDPGIASHRVGPGGVSAMPLVASDVQEQAEPLKKPGRGATVSQGTGVTQPKDVPLMPDKAAPTQPDLPKIDTVAAEPSALNAVLAKEELAKNPRAEVRNDEGNPLTPAAALPHKQAPDADAHLPEIARDLVQTGGAANAKVHVASLHVTSGFDAKSPLLTGPTRGESHVKTKDPGQVYALRPMATTINSPLLDAWKPQDPVTDSNQVPARATVFAGGLETAIAMKWSEGPAQQSKTSGDPLPVSADRKLQVDPTFAELDASNGSTATAADSHDQILQEAKPQDKTGPESQMPDATGPQGHLPQPLLQSGPDNASPALQIDPKSLVEPKLASAEATLPTRLPPPAQQAAAAIAAHGAIDRAAQIELTLTPEDLGAVRFEMRPDAAGLAITLTAERPETLELMRRNLADLMAELRQAGVQTSGFSFGTWSDRPPQTAPGKAVETDGFTEPKPAPLLPTRITRPAENGLDLRF